MMCVKAQDALREQNQALQTVHARMQSAFMTGQATAHERVLARVQGVMEMRDACEDWLAMIEDTLDVAEQSHKEEAQSSEGGKA